MIVWSVWNTFSFVVVLCYFISEALIFFTASVFWLYSEAVVKVMQPKSAAQRYVERSEPIRVSGSHDVDFTHRKITVHYFLCMGIEGYLLFHCGSLKEIPSPVISSYDMRLDVVSLFICY